MAFTLTQNETGGGSTEPSFQQNRCFSDTRRLFVTHCYQSSATTVRVYIHSEGEGEFLWAFQPVIFLLFPFFIFSFLSFNHPRPAFTLKSPENSASPPR